MVYYIIVSEFFGMLLVTGNIAESMRFLLTYNY